MDSLILENVSKIFDSIKSKGKFGPDKNKVLPKKNDKFVALENISFRVPQGEIFGIIGNNGSGKTTLLRTIAGIYHQNQGKITINGRMAPLLNIGTGFNAELVAKENIVLSGMLSGLSKSKIKSKVDEILEFSELKEFENMKLKHYSSGMRARLAFATAIQINPDILLVDEILSVGDYSFRKKSYAAFYAFKKNKKTILYVSHNLDAMAKLCDRILLLRHGKMIMLGNPKEVIEKHKEIIGDEDISKN
ncbi:MAG: ABC transporter ATP-binding protein [Nitrosopumilus sp.]|nr:ABC transporter ATP-binding protein [Nitrosopumilus sp.]MDH3385534.1 ABC transporter ATP-binding protein [Nitrosopumilus sp.]